MKKNIIPIIIILIGFLFVNPVWALTLEKVSILNATDSYKGGNPTIEGNGTANVTITYNTADLKVVAANRDLGRTIDAAWLGVQVFAPKDLEIATLQKATYKSGSTEKSFWNNQDTPVANRDSKDKEHFINVFGAVTEEHLKNATIANKMLSYVWTFDWDNNGEIDQTVKVKINPTGIVLLAKDDDTILWNYDTYEKVRQEITEDKEEPEKDDVPKTSDIYLYTGMILIDLICLGYLIKQLRK